MRMVFTIIVGLTLMFAITTTWYFGNVLVVIIGQMAYTMVSGNPDATAVIGLLEFVSIVWGPVLDIFVVLWLIASAQARDAESEIYG